MPMPLRDIAGRRFGRYVAISRASNGANGATRWLFRCDCGQEKIRQSQAIVTGNVISCGCQAKLKSQETFVERFEAKYIPEPNSGCWLWMGALSKKDGYGTFRAGQRKQLKAHRVMFELNYGKIPGGQEVCHSCDVPSCVNPEHLFLGTHLENMQDCVNKRRHGSIKLTHHEISQIRNAFGKQTQRQIARDFGVSDSTISEIKTGKRW